MPDETGKLSSDEKAKVAKWIDEKGVDHSCPVCKHNTWSVGEHLLSGMIHTGGRLMIGGPAYPSAFNVCNNCAYTRHFMAVPLGILKVEQPSCLSPLDLGHYVATEEGASDGPEAIFR